MVFSGRRGRESIPRGISQEEMKEVTGCIFFVFSSILFIYIFTAVIEQMKKHQRLMLLRLHCKGRAGEFLLGTLQETGLGHPGMSQGRRWLWWPSVGGQGEVAPVQCPGKGEERV